LFRNPFSFLTAGSARLDRVAAYVIREHERGRSLSEIIEDPYVRNRTSPEERARVLERPDVVKAVGDDLAEAAKAAIGGRG
jgi:hypothetical protein